MSREAVAAFLTQVAKDPDLQKELVVFAADRGYEFTTDELNESDLAGIAGGTWDLGDFTTMAAKKKKPAKK